MAAILAWALEEGAVRVEDSQEYTMLGPKQLNKHPKGN